MPKNAYKMSFPANTPSKYFLSLALLSCVVGKQ